MNEIIEAVRSLWGSVAHVAAIVLICAFVAAVRFAVIRMSKEN